MDAIILFTLVFLSFSNFAHAGYKSKCQIVGLKDDDWYPYDHYTFKMPINDTFRGQIIAYKTENILRMRIMEQNYLDATWENQVLTIFTADNFDTYERDSKVTSDPSISIKLSFDCIEDGSESLQFVQKIHDVNNHLPVLNERSYVYSFGMSVPGNYKLTDLLPIHATDLDITNDKVFFTIEEDDNFSLDKEVKHDSKTYRPGLTVLNELKAPFTQKFTLIATDYGVPPTQSKSSLLVNVYDPKTIARNEKESDMVHPPVFGKHLYYADYTVDHEFKLEEPIMIKYGAQDTTVLQQTGFEKYFQVRFEGKSREKVTVDNIHKLSDEMLQTGDFITIEIEAENEGLKNMPGRTALMIRLPGLQHGNSKDCKPIVEQSATGYLIPLVLFLIAVFSIVFINIYLIIMFVNKQRVRVVA